MTLVERVLSALVFTAAVITLSLLFCWIYFNLIFPAKLSQRLLSPVYSLRDDYSLNIERPVLIAVGGEPVDIYFFQIFDEPSNAPISSTLRIRLSPGFRIVDSTMHQLDELEIFL